MKIYTALATFRQKIEPIKKDSDNPFFKSKYADLPSILEVIKPLLKECGLTMYHKCENKDGSYQIVTTLTTDEGEALTSEFPIFGTKPQEIGSSITYARRYNIQALLDLPTEDDDGNKANEAPKTYAGFDLKAFIEDQIRTEKDTNHLVTLYDEAMKNKLSQKQIDWLTKECKERKEALKNTNVIPK